MIVRLHDTVARCGLRTGMARPCFVVALGLALSFHVGCSLWSEPAREALNLPVTRMSRDSVALEITFVRTPVGRAEVNEDLWQHADEQFLTADQRFHLNQNGIRAGLLLSRLPESLQQMLNQQQQNASFDQSPLSSAIDVLAQNRRVQVRRGKRTEVVASPVRKELVVLHKAADGSKVSGNSYREAQCIWALKPYPTGDGAVQVQLTPEVHHGPPRNQWVGGQGTFQFLPGRDREVFADLLVRALLSPGQTLMLSCTPASTGVGHSFFIESGRGDPQQKLLLIRVAQTQLDELFDEPDAVVGK